MLDDNRDHVLTLQQALRKSFALLQKNQVVIDDEHHSNNIREQPFVKLQLCRDNRQIMKTVNDAIQFAMNIKNVRQKSLLEFHSRLSSRGNHHTVNTYTNMNCNYDDDKTKNDTTKLSSWPMDSVYISPSNHYLPNNATTNNTNTNPIPFPNTDKLHQQQLTSLQFKKEFLYSNIPCLILNLNEQEFKPVSTKWVKRRVTPKQVIPLDLGGKTDDRDYHDDGDCKLCINTEWFLQELGSTTIVPVRRNPQRSNFHREQHLKQELDDDNNSQGILEGDGDELDEDGRATECETIQMTMEEWIYYLSELRSQQHDMNNHHLTMKVGDEMKLLDSTLYLKDWHLQNILESSNKWSIDCLDDAKHYTSSSAISAKETLYTIPQIFAGDIFNPFLLSNNGGDYRFVYWGPKDSSTSIHSDVLHTFSWSFNVFGVKKWTFYPPTTHNADRNNDKKQKNEDSINPTTSFEIIQKTGETIYVPSGWKHSVQNLEETLSINHNWITPSTLDEMYTCILCEIQAIDKELMGWGMMEVDDDKDNIYDMDSGIDMEAEPCNLDLFRIREDMLRGCVGLDVTSFCVMIFGCLVDCIDKLFVWYDGIYGGDIGGGELDSLFEHWFDFTSIVNVLKNCILALDNTTSGEISSSKMSSQRRDIMLHHRLCAMLGNELGIKLHMLLSKLSVECTSLIQDQGQVEVSALYHDNIEK